VNVDFDLIGINEEEDNLLDCEKTEGGEVSFKAIFLLWFFFFHRIDREERKVHLLLVLIV
jgi:hypothetical protein